MEGAEWWERMAGAAEGGGPPTELMSFLPSFFYSPLVPFLYRPLSQIPNYNELQIRSNILKKHTQDFFGDRQRPSRARDDFKLISNWFLRGVF